MAIHEMKRLRKERALTLDELTEYRSIAGQINRLPKHQAATNHIMSVIQAKTSKMVLKG